MYLRRAEGFDANTSRRMTDSIPRKRYTRPHSPRYPSIVVASLPTGTKILEAAPRHRLNWLWCRTQNNRKQSARNRTMGFNVGECARAIYSVDSTGSLKNRVPCILRVIYTQRDLIPSSPFVNGRPRALSVADIEIVGRALISDEASMQDCYG
jgi:hypothetical protein